MGEVFAFFADARNLEKLTPPLLKFEVLTPGPIEMGEGVLIDYRLRVHGVPIGWKTEIPVWEPPTRFVDRAIKSPYSLWHHEHTFQEVGGDGGQAATLVRDVVDYRPKGWVLAGAVNRCFVRRDLLEIFRFRTARIAEAFA